MTNGHLLELWLNQKQVSITAGQRVLKLRPTNRVGWAWQVAFQ